MNKYTEAHYDFIRQNVVTTEKHLQKLFNDRFGLNVSLSAIGNLKAKLKLKSGLVGGRFEKGQVPPNKGKKWDEFMSKEGQKNSLRTTFKKGNIPQNHRPVGSERVSVYGYIEVKVAEPNKWKLKHRVVWEKANGPIKKSQAIVFLDGNKMNVDLSNLALLERRELLYMNNDGLFYTDSELTKNGIMISKIKSTLFKKKQKINENKSGGNDAKD